MRVSRRIPRSRLTTALFVNAAALTLIALALLARSGGSLPSVLSPAMAQPQLPIGGGAGVFIVPAQFSGSTYGCYIMDVDAQTVCAYQFIPGEHNFKLVAARSYQYDRRLGNYNTSPPPLEIKTLVEKEKTDVRGMDTKRQPASPESGAPDR